MSYGVYISYGIYLKVRNRTVLLHNSAISYYCQAKKFCKKETVKEKAKEKLRKVTGKDKRKNKIKVRAKGLP